MDIPDLAFNALIGIQLSDDSEKLLVLPFSDQILNHVGTVHASAIFALAEASSGQFLINVRGGRADIGGVVRKAACKYSAPATTGLVSISQTHPKRISEAIEKVDAKGRASVSIDIQIFDETGDALIGKFTFDWLLAK